MRMFPQLSLTTRVLMAVGVLAAFTGVAIVGVSLALGRALLSVTPHTLEAIALVCRWAGLLTFGATGLVFAYWLVQSFRRRTHGSASY